MESIHSKAFRNILRNLLQRIECIGTLLERIHQVMRLIFSGRIKLASLQ